MFKVIVEYKDGEIQDYIVSENAWFNIVYKALEKNDEVENYRVETIKEA